MEMSEVKAQIKDYVRDHYSTTVGTRMMCRLETYCIPMSNTWIS